MLDSLPLCLSSRNGYATFSPSPSPGIISCSLTKLMRKYVHLSISNSYTRADCIRTAEEVSSGVYGRDAEDDVGEDVESIHSIRYSRRSTSNYNQQATPSPSTQRIYLLVRITPCPIEQ